MESTVASTPNEFLNLCYLLTCKSVGEADHFRSWGGVLGGRGKLADELARCVCSCVRQRKDREGAVVLAASGQGSFRRASSITGMVIPFMCAWF